MSSILGWATKIAHVTCPPPKKEEEKCESYVDRTTISRQYEIPNFHEKLIFFLITWFLPKQTFMPDLAYGSPG